VSGGSSQAGRVFVPVKNEVYTHDSDGNLMQDGRWTYHWDAENRLTNMVSVALPNSPPGTTPIRLEFRYDYLGRRIYKGVFTVASPNTPAKQERYVYDGWNVVLVLDGSSVVQRSFLWGMDLSGSMQGAGGVGGLVAIKEHIGTVGTHVPVYDGNGNVTALVTGQGGTSTITGTYEYGPFGESIRSSGTLAKNNPFRFSTKYQDDETDLLYYGYRFYNASTGRWPSRDPIGEEGGVNLHGFVANSPANLVDRNGLDFAGMFTGYNFPTGPLPINPPITDPGDPDSYGWDWLNGIARDAVLGPDSPWTKAMQRSTVMNIDRERAKSALRRHCTPYVGDPASLTIALGGELGEIPSSTYATEIFPGEYKTNRVAAFVGSWTGGSITVLEVDCCKRKAKIHVHGVNVSGRASLTHYPPMGGLYGDHILNDTTNPKAWGHNISQTFDWDESLSF